MRSLSLPLAIVAALVCLQFCFGSNTQAQELRKQIGERHGKPIVNYRPDDPWTRGRVFNLQTGHAGLFFNCDDEECKRNSPYICWKRDYEKMFPTPLGLWGHTKQTWAEVNQRIQDGAGACARDCTCTKCRSRQKHLAQPRGYAKQNQSQKPGSRSMSLADAERPAFEEHAPLATIVENRPAPKFGLISGKIIETKTSPTSTIEKVTPASPLRQVVGRNGFDEYLRNRRKR